MKLRWALPALRLRHCCAKSACGALLTTVAAVRALCRARCRLLVDAAQELPIAEEVARPHLADRKLTVAAEYLERKIGMKADVPGDAGQPSFHQAQEQVVAGKVVDDD